MKVKKILSNLEKVRENVVGLDDSEKMVRAIDEAMDAVKENKKLRNKVEKLKTKVEELQEEEEELEY